MKLLLTIIRDSDAEAVLQALIEAGLRVTRSASTGGFLRRGMTTLMIGLTEDQVEQAIGLIRKHLGPATDASTHRAVLFVLNIEEFVQI